MSTAVEPSSPQVPDAPKKSGGATRFMPKRSRGWLGRHRKSLLLMIPLLGISALVNFYNFTGNPQRIDDEGTYAAQAWAISHLGELAHYTYWYDHPPLGWIQLSLYMEATGALERYGISVMAAREAIIMATVVGTALVYWLCRRLHMGRPAAFFAGLLFVISPLAIQYHRTVYLDNLATFWLLLSLILATARRYQLAGFAASAACFGIAVLTKETYLLAIVLLLWVMIRRSHHQTRRYTLVVAGSVLTLIGISYVILAAVKGEVLPGEDHVSLWDGLAFQLVTRDSSGGATEAGSQTSGTLAQWWGEDPVLCALGALSAVIGVFHPRIRPFAVSLLLWIAIMFRPGGYLPVPYIIMLIPIAAICIAGVTQTGLRSLRSKRAIRKVQGVITVGVLVAAVFYAWPNYQDKYNYRMKSQDDAPVVESQAWIEANIPRSSRMLVDDAMWVDIVTAGFQRENIIWYYKIDTDSAVAELSPNGWRDVDYVITTVSMRAFPAKLPNVAGAIENSSVVASFGDGGQRIDVRAVHPEGIAQYEQEATASIERRKVVGAELASNPNVELSAQAQSQLRNGEVDPRLMLSLAQYASAHDITIGSFDADPGTEVPNRRLAVITEVDGEPATPGSEAAKNVKAWFGSQTGAFTDPSVEQLDGDDTGVRISYPLGEPENLLDPTISAAG